MDHSECKGCRRFLERGSLLLLQRDTAVNGDPLALTLRPILSPFPRALIRGCPRSIPFVSFLDSTRASIDDDVKRRTTVYPR